MSMQVAMVRLDLLVPGARSIKDKRRARSRIIDRVRARYDVAIAEVDALDSHTRLVLGLSAVSNDARLLRSTVDEILRYVEGLYVAELVHKELEILPFPPPYRDGLLPV